MIFLCNNLQGIGHLQIISCNLSTIFNINFVKKI
ncbi:hypothetical protein BHY_1126 (plasmid) [Borrelia nietonii YOR]|uniref:Uncharacterized protein n=1 Tax=Borrelia nietonii YOR TaxID=1293576 RepID=W5SAU2_9SPIR|nr:hypothetical protein BHY_1126 [Borrelia nietonii YOR]